MVWRCPEEGRLLYQEADAVIHPSFQVGIPKRRLMEENMKLIRGKRTPRTEMETTAKSRRRMWDYCYPHIHPDG